MSTSTPLTWRMSRWFWTRWQLLRFRLSKPQKIGVPGRNVGSLAEVPLGQIHPRIPLREVLAVERLPKQESSLGMRILVGAGLVLVRVVRPMRSGLREIDETPAGPWRMEPKNLEINMNG